MTKVDPAHFVVRRDTYSQVQGYPEECARLTETLLQESPKTLNAAYELITQEMRQSPVLNRDWAARTAEERGFGQTLKSGKHWTSLGYARAQDADFVRKRYPEGETRLEYPNPDDRQKRIPLSGIENKFAVSIAHPVTGDEEHKDEQRWSVISQKFLQATDESLTPERRKAASIECYALFSHDCPLKRGSSTTASILLQYIAEKAGFEVGLARHGVDLNVAAITRSVDEFAAEWNKGTFFDKDATPEAVMAWHRKRIGKEPDRAY